MASLSSLGVRGLPPPQDAAAAMEALAKVRAKRCMSRAAACADAATPRRQARAEQAVAQIQALLQERSSARAKLQARCCRGVLVFWA